MTEMAKRWFNLLYHAHTQTHKHTHTPKHLQTQTHTYTHADTHTHTHAETHTHTHTHTHTQEHKHTLGVFNLLQPVCRNVLVAHAETHTHTHTRLISLKLLENEHSREQVRAKKEY